MKNLVRSLNHTASNLLLLFLLLVSTIFIFKEGVIINPDSSGYLNPSIIRSPAYPLFLKLIKIIGGQYFSYLLILSQLLIGVIAVKKASDSLAVVFQFNHWYKLLFSIFLFTPYLIGVKSANSIMTESLAYPVFLIVSTYLIEAINELSLIKFSRSFFFVSLLILIRSQFLFFYPLLILLIIYLTFISEVFRKIALKASIYFLVSIILTISLEMSYHYFAHGKFTRTPFTGIQLATNASYVSSLRDTSLFEESPDKYIFQKIIRESAEKKLIQASINGQERFYDHFQESYNDLCWRTIFPILQDSIDKKNINQLFIEVDKKTTAFSVILLRKNWKKFLRLYVNNIYYGAGGFTGFLWIILLTLVSVLTIFFFPKEKYPLILIFTIGIYWCNVFLVALVEPVMPRYTFYSEILFYSIASILGLIELRPQIEPSKLNQP